MNSIRLRGVTVTYDLLSVDDYNFKRRVIGGVGRKRLRGEHTTLRALSEIDLTIAPGTRLGLIGLNGSGKSTLLRVLAGTLPPTSGEVSIRGRVLPLLGASGAGLDYQLTGLENIMMMGLLLGESTKAMKARIDDLAEFSGLNDRLLNPVSTYSSGMAARLRFAVLTTLRPDILIMDEGVAAADAEFSVRARDRLREFRESAGILVMSSHGAGVRKLCSDAIWLHQGLIVDAGDVDKVYGNYSRYIATITAGDGSWSGEFVDEDVME